MVHQLLAPQAVQAAHLQSPQRQVVVAAHLSVAQPITAAQVATQACLLRQQAVAVLAAQVTVAQALTALTAIIHPLEWEPRWAKAAAAVHPAP